MEVRAELRQPRMSKGLIAVVALSTVLGLGLLAGTVAANLNGSSATTSQTHTIAYGKGGPAFGSVRHGGAQTVEENAAPTIIRGVSPDAQDRKAAESTAAPIYYLPDGLGYRER